MQKIHKFIFHCETNKDSIDLPTKAISSNDSGGNDLGVLAPAKNDSKGNYKGL